jgi:ABC-2 type transport system ATP-binding protein
LNAFVDEVSPGEYKVATAPTPNNVAALTAWLAEHDLPLADLRAGRQRLEDVFLRLTAITGEHPIIRPGQSE